MRLPKIKTRLTDLPPAQLHLLKLHEQLGARLPENDMGHIFLPISAGPFSFLNLCLLALYSFQGWVPFLLCFEVETRIAVRIYRCSMRSFLFGVTYRWLTLFTYFYRNISIHQKLNMLGCTELVQEWITQSTHMIVWDGWTRYLHTSGIATVRSISVIAKYLDV